MARVHFGVQGARAYSGRSSRRWISAGTWLTASRLPEKGVGLLLFMIFIQITACEFQMIAPKQNISHFRGGGRRCAASTAGASRRFVIRRAAGIADSETLPHAVHRGFLPATARPALCPGGTGAIWLRRYIGYRRLFRQVDGLNAGKRRRW